MDAHRIQPGRTQPPGDPVGRTADLALIRGIGTDARDARERDQIVDQPAPRSLQILEQGHLPPSTLST